MKFVFSILIIVIFVVPVSAQDPGSGAMELFRWLPKGIYRELSFSAREVITKSDIYEVYRDCYDPLNIRFLGGSFVPPKYLDDVVYVVRAEPVKCDYRRLASKSNSKAKQKNMENTVNKDDLWSSATIGDSTYEIYSKRSQCYLYYFDAAELVVEELCYSGVIEPVDMQIGDVRVYKGVRRSNSGDETEYFLWAELNVVIAAQDLEFIRKMINTYNQGDLNIIDDPQVNKAFDYVSNRSVEFWYYDMESVFREVAERALEHGESGDDVGAYLESLENFSSRQFVGFSLKERMGEIYLNLFVDKKSAEQSYRQKMQSAQQGVKIELVGPVNGISEISEYNDATVEALRKQMKLQVQKHNERLQKIREEQNKTEADSEAELQ